MGFMYEGLTPHDEFAEDEQVLPAACIPLSHNGIELTLTPANAAVRMFFGDGLEEYNRVMVYLNDGCPPASFKPEDELMHSMVRGGFPVELPDKPDESDREFMDEYMRLWTQDATTALGL